MEMSLVFNILLGPNWTNEGIFKICYNANFILSRKSEHLVKDFLEWKHGFCLLHAAPLEPA